LKFSGSKFIIPFLYANDIVMTSNDVNFLHKTKQMLRTHFDIKDLKNALFLFWAFRFIVIDLVALLVYLRRVISRGF